VTPGAGLLLGDAVRRPRGPGGSAPPDGRDPAPPALAERSVR